MGMARSPRRISPLQGTILTLGQANPHHRLRFTRVEKVQTNLWHL